VGIENQGLKGRFRIAQGRRQLFDHRLHDVVNAQAFLGRYKNGRIRVQPQVLFDLIFDPVNIRRRQVDLVDYRDNFQIVFQGQIEVGQGLGLHTLAGIDEKQGTFAGGQGPGNFVGEVHMARGVDQVQKIGRSCHPWLWYGRHTVWLLMVMPRSRSISMVSRIWSLKSRSAMILLDWIKRSDRVDFPWSI
jgi:hypothetical protein